MKLVPPLLKFHAKSTWNHTCHANYWEWNLVTRSRPASLVSNNMTISYGMHVSIQLISKPSLILETYIKCWIIWFHDIARSCLVNFYVAVRLYSTFNFTCYNYPFSSGGYAIVTTAILASEDTSCSNITRVRHGKRVEGVNPVINRCRRHIYRDKERPWYVATDVTNCWGILIRLVLPAIWMGCAKISFKSGWLVDNDKEHVFSCGNEEHYSLA